MIPAILAQINDSSRASYSLYEVVSGLQDMPSWARNFAAKLDDVASNVAAMQNKLGSLHSAMGLQLERHARNAAASAFGAKYTNPYVAQSVLGLASMIRHDEGTDNLADKLELRQNMAAKVVGKIIEAKLPPRLLEAWSQVVENQFKVQNLPSAQ